MSYKFQFYFLNVKINKYGEGNGSPLQYPCLGNPIDRQAWQATVHGVAELDTIKHAPSFYSLHRGERN